MSIRPQPSLAAAPSRRDDRRLVRLHRLCTVLTAMAALALLGLVEGPMGSAGQLGLLALGPCLMLHAAWPSLSRSRAWSVLATILAVLGIAAAAVPGIEPRLAVGASLAALQVHQASGAREPGEHRLAMLPAMLAALLVCTQSATPLLAPGLLLLTLSGASSLILSATVETSVGAARSRATVGLRQGLALGALLATVVVLAMLAFLAVPRNPARPPRIPTPTRQLVGFDQQVRLGDLATNHGDPTPIFRAQVVDARGRALPGPFYYRAVSLDTFDGLSWSSRSASETIPEPSEPGPDAIMQSYRFEPTAPPVLVAVPRLEALSLGAEAILLRPNRTLLDREGPRPLSYQAWSRSASWRAAGSAQMSAVGAPPGGLFLELPATLDPGIRELAQTLAPMDATADERIAALASWFTRDHHYQLDGPGVGETDPLAAFMLEHRSGNCELFATGLAVMLRQAGLPSRVVNGFHGGEWNPAGSYWLLRQSDAHAWVEVWLDGQGWLTLDPTPEVTRRSLPMAAAVLDHAATRWNHDVLDYELADQLEVLAAPGSLLRQVLRPTRAAQAPSAEAAISTRDLGLSLALFTLLAVLAALTWRRLAPWLAGERRRRRQASGKVERCLRAARRLLRRRGWNPPAWLPPQATARWLEQQAGPAARPFGELARLHYEVRYGGRDDDRLAAQASAALASLRSLPRAG